jgi:hypothetical protein
MKVSDGQTLFDIAIRYCGDASEAIAIAILNGISITDDLVTAQPIDVLPTIDSDISGYYDNKGLCPATGITTPAESALIEEGIEFWSIEYD